MSANNWTTCPKCFKENAAKIKQLRNDVNSKYGKMDRIPFTNLQDKVDKEVAQLTKVDPTFREDYHIVMEGDGTFKVGYYGACIKCNAEHYFQHEDKLDIN